MNLSLPTTCVSSCIMSSLMQWRNQEAPNYLYFKPENKSEEVIDKFKLRVISTEIALGLLTSVSIIETVVYSLIFMPLAYLINNKSDLKLMKELASSSSFTTIWIVNSLFSNIFFKTLPTYESYARLGSKLSKHYLKLHQFRVEDINNTAYLIASLIIKNQQHYIKINKINCDLINFFEQSERASFAKIWVVLSEAGEKAMKR